MKIECLFILREATGSPELVAAWDEYLIFENPEGWKSECNDTLKQLEGDFLSSRYVSIDISETELLKAMGNAEISGKLVE